MASPPELIDQVSAFHADAFGWAVACSGGDAEAAADTLQECYVKVATGRATFSGRSSLKTWWLAVIRLTVFEQRRGKQRWQRRVDAFRDWLALFGRESPETPEQAFASPDPDHLLAALSPTSGAAVRDSAPAFSARPECERGCRRDGRIRGIGAPALRTGQETPSHPAGQSRSRTPL